MASAPEKLRAAALALPREERAELARQLIDSLGEENPIETAWQHEVLRRLEAYRLGNFGSQPAEDVFDEAHRRMQS